MIQHRYYTTFGSTCIVIIIIPYCQSYFSLELQTSNETVQGLVSVINQLKDTAISESRPKKGC